MPAVYTCSTLALAALEYLVHVDIEDVPDDLVAMSIEVPDDAALLLLPGRDRPSRMGSRRSDRAILYRAVHNWAESAGETQPIIARGLSGYVTSLTAPVR